MAASYLRPQLLRSSKAAFECALCAQRRSPQLARLRYTSALGPRLSRSYATVNPRDPKPPPEDPQDKKKKGAENAQKAAGEGGGEKKNEEPEKKPDDTLEMTPLTEEEIKQINDVANMIKTGLPKSQADAVDEAAELMKKGGIPQELRELLEVRRQDPKKRIDLATTVRLVGLFTKMSRMTAEEVRQKYGANAEPP